MHTWRGIGILVIFATIGEKEKFLTPPHCAQDAETHKKRTRAAAEKETDEKFRYLASTVLAVFTDKFG